MSLLINLFLLYLGLITLLLVLYVAYALGTRIAVGVGEGIVKLIAALPFLALGIILYPVIILPLAWGCVALSTVWDSFIPIFALIFVMIVGGPALSLVAARYLIKVVKTRLQSRRKEPSLNAQDC